MYNLYMIYTEGNAILNCGLVPMSQAPTPRNIWDPVVTRDVPLVRCMGYVCIICYEVIVNKTEETDKICKSAVLGARILNIRQQ